MDGVVYGVQFVFCFDIVCVFGNFFVIMIFEVCVVDCVKFCGLDFVDVNLCMFWCMGGQQVCYFGGKGIGCRVDLVVVGEIEYVGVGVVFVNEWIVFGEEGCVFVILENYVVVGVEQVGLEWVMCVLELYVGCVGGVVDVQGVEY